jgi:phosphatidylglycerophosphatase A
VRRLFLSFLGAGYLRPAPGTWGSLAAFPAGWLIYELGGPLVLALGAAALYFAGVAAVRAEIAGAEDHDPGWIVIDEVVGQWIALLPVAFGASAMNVPVGDLWPGLLTAFVLFRLFDVWKPWLAGRADARGDAVGLMLDDVWAGLFAAIGVLALAALGHGVLM